MIGGGGWGVNAFGAGVSLCEMPIVVRRALWQNPGMTPTPSKGALSGVRADDLGAIPLKALMERNPRVDWAAVDDIIYGCANQAGEDNRNVARMAGLLAGLPVEVPGTTVNRLCGSGMDAVGLAARRGQGDPPGAATGPVGDAGQAIEEGRGDPAEAAARP